MSAAARRALLVLIVVVLAGAGAVAVSSARARSDRRSAATRRQIATLDATDAYLTRHYSSLIRTALGRSGLGPQDVLGYRVGALWRRGIDGAGTTVALLEGWDDPRLGRVVAGFDRTEHLPAARISTLEPNGSLPRRCPAAMLRLGPYGNCAGWGLELELDVLSVHLVAPYARILLVITPAADHADPVDAVAPPQMMRAAELVARRHLADVISVSDGSGETTYPRGEILHEQIGPLAAAAAGIPFVNPTGDCGAAQELPVAHSFACHVTTRVRDVTTWADSPWVTAVGGSIPDLDPATGAQRGSDPVDPLEGAGLSRVFPRPAYQDGVASITHSAMRSVPDITMNSTSGTSEAAPLFAAVLALATQADGGRVLGPVNPALYALGPRGAAVGIEDVTRGNDTFVHPFTHAYRVPGFRAAPGFDVASGWGTVDASRFVPSLVAETRRLDGEAAARQAAAAALRELTGS